MQALRNGFKLGGRADSEENSQQTESENESSRQEQVVVCANAKPMALALEPETTMKTKLISAWNSVKYGKNGWTNAGDIFRQGFSKNSPVWLLGLAYHRKLVVGPSDSESGSPVGNKVTTFAETDSGIEAFEADYRSKLWMSYRRNFEEVPGTTLTSDCGWGCMLRSGQMMIAQALVLHWLGRHWRRRTNIQGEEVASLETWKQDRLHRAILRLFGDNADSSACPLSLHCLVGLAAGLGRRAGDWFGPGTTAHLLAGAVRQSQRLGGRGLLEAIAVYVAQDGAVYKGDVEDLCSVPDERTKENLLEEDFSLVEVPSQGTDSLNFSLEQEVEIDGETWCLEQESRNLKPDDSLPASSWKALMLLVPMRLGAETLNPIYASCLKALFTMETCLGIIGGKPKHSLYFVGFQDEDLIHLDPHRLQDSVDTLQHTFITESYHCKQPRKLKLGKMDPSCAVGFYLRTREEFDAWCEGIGAIVTPPQIAGIRRDYPLFSVLEGRNDTSQDGSGEDWVRLAGQAEPTTSVDGETEAEDFEFL